MKKLIFLIAVILILSFASFNNVKARGYSIEDGKIYYTDWNKNKTLLEKVDIDTFSIVQEDDYAKDKSNVYCYGSVIEDADPGSFSMVKWGYSKDKNYIFYAKKGKCVPIKLFDPETFEMMSNGYYFKDKNNVIYNNFSDTPPDYGFVILEDADTETFEKLDYPYSRDKDSVYYYDKLIKDADPNSFYLYKYGYNKDKNNVYLKEHKLENADPSSFEVLSYGFSKDKNNYYKDGKIITDENELHQAISMDPDSAYDKISERLKGKILLQVEQNGEAWYVHPNKKRYFLNRPQDAFNIMRSFGTGMSNRDFEKIQVADMNLLTGSDSDNDGLSDQIEDALGTDKNKSDTDGDGYNDKDEILKGYDPTGDSKLDIDPVFVEGRKGFIYIQADQNGEAWYINPNDSKRYFLGRPQDAFNVMRSLGLGITDENLNLISEDIINSP